MTEERKSPTKKKYPPAYEKPYQFRKGQEVKIAFLDGKTITGSVYQFSKYHIVLELEGKSELVTVFKHAMKYIISKKSEIAEIERAWSIPYLFMS